MFNKKRKNKISRSAIKAYSSYRKPVEPEINEVKTAPIADTEPKIEATQKQDLPLDNASKPTKEELRESAEKAAKMLYSSQSTMTTTTVLERRRKTNNKIRNIIVASLIGCVVAGATFAGVVFGLPLLTAQDGNNEQVAVILPEEESDEFAHLPGNTPMVSYEILNLSSAVVADEKTPISMSLASAYDILEVRIVDGEGNAVTDEEFTITIIDPDGDSEEYEIEDGMVEVKELEKDGRYVVTLHPSAEYSTIAPQVIDLKPDAKIVPLTDEELEDLIKDESDIDVSKEDAALTPKPSEPEEPGSQPTVITPVASTVTVVTTKHEETFYKPLASSTNGFEYNGEKYKFVMTGEYISGVIKLVPETTAQASLSLMNFSLVSYLINLTTDGVDPQTEGDGTGGENAGDGGDDTNTDSTSDPISDPSNDSTSSESSSDSVSESVDTTPTDTTSESASSSITYNEEVQPNDLIFDADGKIRAEFAGFVETVTIPAETKNVYTGEQEIDGKKYYYDSNGHMVTGLVSIGGVIYNYGVDGVLIESVGVIEGLDVSKYQPNVDWHTVKASGIDFVIIRVGYRGYSTGVLVEDPYYKQHIQGALAAGLDVGVYIFSQAITVQEAIEEASFCLSLTQGYPLKYGITIDTEYQPGGRANNVSTSVRTQIVNAFCDTVRSGGKTAMIYASKSWFLHQLDFSAVDHNRIWLAHYTTQTDFAYNYDIWQYTGSGTCPGVAGLVDRNYAYTSF